MFADDDLVREKSAEAIGTAKRYNWDDLHEKMTEVYTKVASGEYSKKEGMRS